jgi:hypothetical protein
MKTDRHSVSSSAALTAIDFNLGPDAGYLFSCLFRTYPSIVFSLIPSPNLLWVRAVVGRRSSQDGTDQVVDGVGRVMEQA